MIEIKTVATASALLGLLALGSFASEQCFELQKITAEDGKGNDLFGEDVAMEGDAAIIGATFANGNESGTGAAYVYRRDGTLWLPEQKLFAADGARDDLYGTSVDICGDLTIIGARSDDGQGSAYIRRWNGVEWLAEAKIPAPQEGGSFGRFVAIDGDVVGVVGNPDQGAYVYRYDGEVWNQEQHLPVLCNSIDISGDTLVLGYNPDGGIVHVYEWNGIEWTLQQDLTGRGVAFGNDVSLDGNVLMVGDHRDEENGDASGAAYVFRRTGGIWFEEQKLFPSDARQFIRFGISVTIEDDVAVVGSTQDVRPGVAYVFTFDGTVWTERSHLVASDADSGDAAFYVALSSGVAFAGDGRDDDRGHDSGAAYVFDVLRCPCVPDLDGNADVGFGDLLLLLAAWGPCDCLEDLDSSGDVGFADLLLLLAAWGPCTPVGACCFAEETCKRTEEQACAALGGVYRGDDTTCEEDCPIGACCFPDGTCAIEVRTDCMSAGGIFQGALTDCPAEGCRPVDDCEDTAVVTDGVYSYSTVGATDDGPSLPPECDEGNGVTFRRDVWIRYVAPCTGTATASVCDADFNTKLAVYDASACPGNIIACSDDACGEGGTRSETTFSVVQGEEYLVRIGGRTSTGTGTLVLNCEEGS